MRFTCVFALAFLSFVSTTPTRNTLKDDLKQPAEDTIVQIRRQTLKSTIQTCQAVIASKAIDQKDIGKWQAYLDQLVSWDSNWAESSKYLSDEYIEATGIVQEVPADLQIPALKEIGSKLDEFTAQVFAKFTTKAVEAIRVSKAAGYTDEKFDKLYNKYLENPNLNFYALLVYLKE